jgi:hypothetical protein
MLATFSNTKYGGFLLLKILTYSKNKPLFSPSKPSLLFLEMLKSWQGEPPTKTSKSGSSLVSILDMSP